jgi:HAMP domain-containing protein
MRSRVRQARDSGLPRNPAANAGAGAPKFIALESTVEDLGLSVRTRNALRGIGCDTVEDILELDLANPIRGVGRKTRDELLTALELAGFPHRAAQDQPATEIRILERSLERMQGRVEAALGAVAKEIRMLKQRLHKASTRRGN